MPDAAHDSHRHELLWREYQMGVDLYKFYLELILKIIIAYYAITGGILSFYFTRSELPLARWALLFPSVISFALAVLFWWGAKLWQVVRDNAFEIADRLELETVFELGALRILLRGGAALLAMTGGAMLTLLLVDAG